MIKPWKILSSKPVISDQYITVRTDSCERSDGHIVPTYHVIDFPMWTLVVPLTDKGNIVLVREYRHPANVIVTGIPGGGGEPDETDFEAIGRRELVEETGYTPREMHHIGRCYPNPATQTNQINFFLALGCVRTTEQSLDANEQIEVLEMPFADYLRYEHMSVQHAHHAAALYYTERYFLKHPELRPTA
ncbi:MAG: NUDIX hydrolase [Pseudomonadota bacterium]